MARGRINGASNQTRTHSYRFASLRYIFRLSGIRSYCYIADGLDHCTEKVGDTQQLFLSLFWKMLFYNLFLNIFFWNHPIWSLPFFFFFTLLLFFSWLGNLFQSMPVGCPRDVMVKAMDYGNVGSEFVLKSRYYVHFRANTLGKGTNPLILPAMD